MSRRALLWVGSARKHVRAFPPRARRRAGHLLDLLQQGLQPTDSKPMPTVGSGVYELRIRAEAAFRVFYVAKFAEGIYVLHGFEKKTQQTVRLDIEASSKCYRRLVKERRSD
ncbi:MAG: type II toxin-antitoxin system RelE/ParE family toxin [Gemmatimonadaceae bacterium]